MYKRNEKAIAAAMAREALQSCPADERRLRLDIADLLTGPTSGHEADRLADLLVRANDPREIALRLIEIGQRMIGGAR